jgi:hypothetical protein
MFRNMIENLSMGVEKFMEEVNAAETLIRDPLAWAADCEAQAKCDSEQAAQDAFRQLAEEFQAAAAEIEGLVSTFEALIRRKTLNKDYRQANVV